MVTPATPPQAPDAPRMSVPAALLDQVIAYLARRPFQEVVGLIGQLQVEARPIANEPPKEEA